MENTKLDKLMQNEEFLKKILPLETPEEVQKAFGAEGVQITLDEVKILGEIINKSIEKGVKPLTQEDLESISGGNLRDFVYGFLGPVLNGPGQIVGGVMRGDKGMLQGGIGFTLALGGLVIGSAAAGIGAYKGVKWGIKKIKSRKKK